jgi:hypothetical protein
MGQKMNPYRISVRKKERTGTTRMTREDNIKMNLGDKMWRYGLD